MTKTPPASADTLDRGLGDHLMRAGSTMAESLVPEAQIIYGQLEDALGRWQSRPDEIHQRYIDAADEVTRLCGDMISVFGRLRDQTTVEVGQYRDGGGELLWK